MAANAKELKDINTTIEDTAVEARRLEEKTEEKKLERNLLSERAHYKPFRISTIL